MVRQVGFAQAYSFKYSPRPGTPAANMDQLPEAVKADRLSRLQGLLNHQQTSFNSGCIGKIFPVLFERLGRRAGQLIGRSPYLQAVHADAAPELLGDIMPVEIAAAGPNSLSGVIKAACNCPAPTFACKGHARLRFDTHYRALKRWEVRI